MLIVVGSITARPDSVDALRGASLEHVHRSRAEDGCISHAVHIDVENPLRLFFFERWRDRASLEAHGRQPGSRAFLTEVRAGAASSEPITVYEADQLAL